MSHTDPTKVAHGLMGKRMRRELLARAPEVSVVTQTIYASSTSTASAVALPTGDTSIPLGPIAGGVAGGVVIVLLVVGGWIWWGSRLRAAKHKSEKARRAQDLANARTGHGKTESTETLNSTLSKSKSYSSHVSEKSATNSTHEPVKKPSAILAQQPKSRAPFTQYNAPSTTSLASSKYAPSRPSPLALGVVTRAPSVMSENPPTVIVSVPQRSEGGLSPQAAALRSIAPLPPSLKVVPPSPPPPAQMLLAPAKERVQRQSVQSVQTIASDYSLDSPVGVAYGGDELEREAYTNPRDEWRESRGNVMDRMGAAAQARQPDYFSRR